MAEKERGKKTKTRKTKRRGTKDSQTLQKEWDEYSRRKDEKDKEKKLKQPKEGKRDKSHKKRKGRKDKTPKSEAATDGFGVIQNKSKLKVKAKSGNVKKIEFEDHVNMGQKHISYGTPRGTRTPRTPDGGKRKKSKDNKMKRAASAVHLEDAQKEKERLKQQRLDKLKRIRAEKAAKHKDEQSFNAMMVPTTTKTESKSDKKPKRKRTQSKAQKHAPDESPEEKKARKQREKKERLERLKKMRLKHEDQQKKTQQELQAFVEKRDSKRYLHPFNKYPQDKSRPKQLIYPSLKQLKELCPLPEWRYDPNKKNNEPILNPFGLSITHMDCLVSYYMVDTQWNARITKAQYVECIKQVLKIKEWNDDKINIVWNNLQQAKGITQQYLSEYKEDMKDEKEEDLQRDVVYNYQTCDDGLTIADFINGLELTKQEGNSAVYDFYYLLLGCHYFDDSLAEDDDWHGDFTQRVLWLKQFGEKARYLYSVDTGQSYSAACHGLMEYRAIICSLLNVDFIPPSDKHSGEIISKFRDLMTDTVGSIKLFQYEWFQAEVMIGAAKVAILRSDIMYASMKPINTILRECDRLLTMLESKVLVQLAMHLMKVIVIHCPNKQQDLLLKELSGLISHQNYAKRPFNPLQQLLLLLLVAIDRYNIQNSRTWKNIAAVSIFACNHDKQPISDLGEEVLWRIYTFSPSVGEDVLSNKMEKKKARLVRKALGIEKYWEEQARQKGEMKTIKIYQDTDPIPNHWKKLTYNPGSSEMSPARLWTMMQKVVFGEGLRLLEEHPSMNYDDFVKGLTECQTYLRSASVRALFQCLPRKHRPFVTKQEFIDFICIAHVAPNRRHYSLRIKELLTIVEDKWKTEAAEKKRVAEQKAIEREQERLRKKAERQEKKRLREEKKRDRERKRKEKEQRRKEERLAKLEAAEEAERLAKLEEEQEAERKQKEKEEKEKEASEKESKREKKKKKKEKKNRKEKKKKKKKAPPLDTSLREDETHEVIREPSPTKSGKHTKTKTREEMIMDDVVALLDFGEDEDEEDYRLTGDKPTLSDAESEVSVMQHNPAPSKTAGFSVKSNRRTNSAMNTPYKTGAGDETPAYPQEFLDEMDFESEAMQDVEESMYDALLAMGSSTMSVIGAAGKLNAQQLEEIKKEKMGHRKICGIRAKKIYSINRDDVYEQRSKILFDKHELASAFKKKMGKDFCLNAAGAKVIFVAGMQDKGCACNPDQLDIIYCGVQYFLPMFEYDLPLSIAEWIVHDETEQDKTSRSQRDDKRWEKEKVYLPTYLKHELIAFMFGETYFDLTDQDRKKKKLRRKKGEPVVHRNKHFVGSCVSELHDAHLPKKQYKRLIWGFCRESYGNDTFYNLSKSILYCVSFFMPLSTKGPDAIGRLEVRSLTLDRTYHPEKMSAEDGYNEYDSIRIKRTGRITTIPFEADSGKGGVLLIRVYGELFIERHATLDADSCGYLGGWHHQSQGDSIYRCGKTGKYCNYGGGGGGYYGGGGGYGSRGTTPKTDYPNLLSRGEGGRSYGTRLVHQRACMGSGGGSGGGKYLFSRGGRGGGVVVVIAGSIHNKGRIMALGQRGRYLAGSGAGGSIVVDCNSYYHYGKGAILASSLDPYPDIDNKGRGGIGGCGRVAIKINRQKWTVPMIKAICTNNIKEIWNPAAWIYPPPKWVSPDKMNDKSELQPKLVGFHRMSRIVPTVYKNCTIFRSNDDGDGALVNRFTKYGEREHKEVQAYKRKIEKEKKALYDWKFEEFALHYKQASNTNYTVSYRGSVKGTGHAGH